ncbi:hypothetical protein BX616_000842 [Lobosporangium transversale]|uniref:Ribosomal protein S7 domain-containing protein n=1 Tax=Lobosporangium transversale TaxID=64571 RepID=A0A1Y2H4U1_9FUNG|nr:ribosomal protein S7 domain-containing protein [Lobosporangium transversale]KAF9919154.1 hypothetical protein BX616_000842 [Lobosporangium transversale]ORZ28052.1 ribosomal protein S7 domain-containing protein [Lobosporangium transversale]|eukprot:XP_021885755.1 ribosomal protein S7 domain-containing protein [Lobosporangium transversale]
MLRTIHRLGLVSNGRFWAQQSPMTGTHVGRMSVAFFHTGSRPNSLTGSPNVATTPSKPLPPPMVATSMQSKIGPSLQTQQSSVIPPAEINIDNELETEGVEDRHMSSAFAEFVPVLPELARSMDDNPILKQLVNTIMKDGKKARAQRFVADTLLEIRSRTQSDPYQVILDALELASPILKLTPIKKGSKVLQVPNPMTERQRRRKAIVWILEASDKRKGEKKFKDRLASEFLAVVNGNSGALIKKNQQHKMALANRANASLKY